MLDLFFFFFFSLFFLRNRNCYTSFAETNVRLVEFQHPAQARRQIKKQNMISGNLSMGDNLIFESFFSF